MLKVERLGVHYGQIHALRQVSLYVASGEIVTLVGANGAGKSSLLNAIAGVIRPSSGSINWNGQAISNMPSHQVARLGISFVPEGRQLLTSMSVLDNLLLGCYIHCLGSWRRLFGLSRNLLREPQIQERLAWTFELFPILKDRQNQAAGTLSGGQQQMVAIARALMSSPQILLMDEPSIGLAPNLVREIFSHVAKLKEAGLTILLAEQDALGAIKIADRGYVLERGRIVLEGLARDLVDNDRVRRAYLGKAKVRAI